MSGSSPPPPPSEDEPRIHPMQSGYPVAPDMNPTTSKILQIDNMEHDDVDLWYDQSLSSPMDDEAGCGSDDFLLPHDEGTMATGRFLDRRRGAWEPGGGAGPGTDRGAAARAVELMAVLQADEGRGGAWRGTGRPSAPCCRAGTNCYGEEEGSSRWDEASPYLVRANLLSPAQAPSSHHASQHHTQPASPVAAVTVQTQPITGTGMSGSSSAGYGRNRSWKPPHNCKEYVDSDGNATRDGICRLLQRLLHKLKEEERSDFGKMGSKFGKDLWKLLQTLSSCFLEEKPGEKGLQGDTRGKGEAAESTSTHYVGDVSDDTFGKDKGADATQTGLTSLMRHERETIMNSLMALVELLEQIAKKTQENEEAWGSEDKPVACEQCTTEKRSMKFELVCVNRWLALKILARQSNGLVVPGTCMYQEQDNPASLLPDKTAYDQDWMNQELALLHMCEILLHMVKCKTVFGACNGCCESDDGKSGVPITRQRWAKFEVPEKKKKDVGKGSSGGGSGGGRSGHSDGSGRSSAQDEQSGEGSSGKRSAPGSGGEKKARGRKCWSNKTVNTLLSAYISTPKMYVDRVVNPNPRGVEGTSKSRPADKLLSEAKIEKDNKRKREDDQPPLAPLQLQSSGVPGIDKVQTWLVQLGAAESVRVKFAQHEIDVEALVAMDEAGMRALVHITGLMMGRLLKLKSKAWDDQKKQEPQAGAANAGAALNPKDGAMEDDMSQAETQEQV